jgi:Zn-dependent peptidase ImmA (M78 family)
MIYSDKIRIGALDYKLKFANRVYDPETKEDELGEILFESQKINIAKNMAKQRTNYVILHEIRHAIDEQCGIDITESQTQAFCSLFLQCCRDNKKLMKNVLGL